MQSFQLNRASYAYTYLRAPASSVIQSSLLVSVDVAMWLASAMKDMTVV